MRVCVCFKTAEMSPVPLNFRYVDLVSIYLRHTKNYSNLFVSTVCCFIYCVCALLLFYFLVFFTAFSFSPAWVVNAAAAVIYSVATRYDRHSMKHYSFEMSLTSLCLLHLHFCWFDACLQERNNERNMNKMVNANSRESFAFHCTWWIVVFIIIVAVVVFIFIFTLSLSLFNTFQFFGKWLLSNQ